MFSPVNTELQTRFAKSYADAAFGYARAASAAYAAFAGQALDFWASAARQATASTAGASSPSYSVPVHHPMAALSVPASPNFFQMTYPWADASRMAFAPVAAWWGLAPFQTNPASWPMAYAMMTAGVPRSVALPAAEANVAAMNAAEAATASMKEAFSTYRSGSGFAVSQVIVPRDLPAAAFFAPFSAALAPWLLSAGSRF